MDKKLMMQYLETVSQMECQVYTLNRVYWKLHNKSEQLGHPKSFAQPEKPRKEKLSAGDMLLEIFWSLIRVFPIWFLGLAVIDTVKMKKYRKIYSGFFEWVPQHIEMEVFSQSLCIATIIALLAAIALSIWSISYRRKEIEAKNKRFEEKMLAWENVVAADNLRVQKELEVKAELCAQRDAVLAEYWSAKNALDALYGLDIIMNEERYRDFAAVTTFYSYFRKEYVDRLLGPRQAYDRYDEALQIGEIINKLDIIINKLDEIVRNQAYMVALLRGSNDTLRRIEQGNKKMLDSMERTEDNVELIEYNTKCAAQSSEAIERLTLYSILKED